MGIEQGLIGVGLLFGGALALVSAILGLMSTMDSSLGYSLAFGGVISMIIGYITLQTNG